MSEEDGVDDAASDQDYEVSEQEGGLIPPGTGDLTIDDLASELYSLEPDMLQILADERNEKTPRRSTADSRSVSAIIC